MLKTKIFWIIIIFLILIFGLFKIDSVQSLNDISKMNRVIMYDKDGQVFYESNNLHEGSYLTIEEVPKLVKEIFIFSEDKNFYRHNGFDIYRITKSIVSNSSSGASTITQQLIKNLYFSNNRSYIRKGKEIYLSMRLEAIYTKEEILEAYFNTLYFNHKIYGLKDAAAFYFNKNVYELTISEIAILANIIKNPTLFSPILNYDKALVKRNYLLKAIYKEGLISNDELSEAVDEKVIITNTRTIIYNDAVLYYKDLVLTELKKIKVTKDFNQTISIYTAFNSQLNSKLAHTIKNRDLKGNTSAIITDEKGYYVSIIGGKSYTDSSLNIALDGTRQIASTVKPLLYYYALEQGYNPMTKINGEKSSFTIDGIKYTFANSANLYENTPIPMAYALATSDNMYALKLHTFLELKGISSILNRFGIKSKRDIQQALGNVSMSLKNLLEIYHTFQNLGLHTNFKAIKKVVVNKKTFYTSYPSYKRILNENTTYVMNEMMTLMFDSKLNHIRKVTGNSISSDIKYKVAGKSGTTDKDSYMIGFNKQYLIGIWTGNDNNLSSFDSFFSKDLFVEAFNYLVKNDEWHSIPAGVDKKIIKINSFSNYERVIYYLK